MARRVVTRLAARWCGTALMALTTALGVLCLVVGARRIGQSFPGFMVANNRVVISDWHTGAPPGDPQHLLSAKVIAIDDNPVTGAAELLDRLASLPAGTQVSYRFRKDAEVFTATLPLRRFQLRDYFALHVTSFAAGICFIAAGLWTLWRAPATAALPAFLTLCQCVALVLFTRGDAHGPYWFNSLHYAALCVVPAALLHFAASYPERIPRSAFSRGCALVTLYAAFGAVAITLLIVEPEPSLSLPLGSTVYLVIANALLLYLGRLALQLWSGAERDARPVTARAFAGVLVPMFPAAVLVVAPAIQGPLPAAFTAASLALFPLLTGSVLVTARPFATDRSPRPSVRLRLSLLFLGAVQTAFLVGVAVFLIGNSYDRLLEDTLLNQRRSQLCEHLLAAPAPEVERDIARLAALMESAEEDALTDEAQAELARGNTDGVRSAVTRLAELYREAGDRLVTRRTQLARLAATLVLALIGISLLQALGFMVAVRRWLIQPIDRLAAATSIIATGDLDHRAEFDASEEFATLAGAINAMATSLGSIQRRIDASQKEREHAAGAARDAERRRVARELHDGVLQDLGAIKLILEGERKQRPAAQLAPAIEGIIRVIADLRRIVDELRPPDVGPVSLAAAISQHARVLTHGNGIGLTLVLPERVEVAEWATRDVYRIAQEAISNAVRHSAPAHLTVRLQQRQRETVLEVHDDGTGFDPQRVTRGSGLFGMQERAAALGAALDIHSAPGQGTRVCLVVPMQLGQ